MNKYILFYQYVLLYTCKGVVVVGMVMSNERIRDWWNCNLHYDNEVEQLATQAWNCVQLLEEFNYGFSHVRSGQRQQMIHINGF